MKLSIFFLLFFSVKALDAEKSLAYFTPTGEYLPSADWSKLFPGTSEKRPATIDDVKQVFDVPKGTTSLARKHEPTTPKNSVVKERELKKLNMKSVGENVQITVGDQQEAKNLIEKFKKIGFTDGKKAKVVKKKKLNKSSKSKKSNSSSKKKSKKTKIILLKNKQ